MLKWNFFRSMMIVAAPFMLGILELWHPESVVFDVMLKSPDLASWWLTIHLLQLPLFGLLAVSMYRLTDSVPGIFRIISRIATWFFIVYYIALDSIAGIATGILFHQLQALGISSVENEEVSDILFNIFQSIFNLDAPGVHMISKIAVYSWMVAGLAAAIALLLKGVNRLGVVMIAIAAITFQSHAYPNGPMSMFILTVGVICVEFYRWKLTEVNEETRT